MPHGELCSLVGFNFHHGAFAIADIPPLRSFSKEGLSCGEPGLIRRRVFLCLWDVTDPSNLGALVRTAAGLGAEGVLIGTGCANPYYRKTIRASMGNVFSIPLWETDLNALAMLRERGVQIIAASLAEESKPIETFLYAPGKSLSPCILVLGNEGYGLPEEALKLCCHQVCIPMNNEVDSLNVAVAGGILMYKILRV
jgi:tRNA G18 (ribose-2'-O)-methylase SpoU